MFGFDPLYFLFVGPAFLLSLFAQVWVKSSFSRYGRVANRRGLTGAEAAQRILAREGITNVRIEMAEGHLTDHYDPRHKVLRLSSDVFARPSLAAVGVAAHEAGHALQDARGYGPLVLRSALVPVASLGSNLSWILLMVGMALQAMALVKVGLLLFGTAVAFQVVTLPVEFNASRRALAALGGAGILSREEMGGARRVLSAAAMTYVAAAVTAILTLLYFLVRSGLLGGRRDD